MWVNTVNNKKYVGSSCDLYGRFSAYYSIANLVKYNTTMINRALLKYGYSAFSLHILEYCDEDVLIQKQQYYLYLIKPEYNLLKVTDSSLGWKQC